MGHPWPLAKRRVLLSLVFSRDSSRSRLNTACCQFLRFQEWPLRPCWWRNGHAKRNKSCRRSRWGHLRGLLYCRCPSGWLVRRAIGNYHVQETICKVPNEPFHPRWVERLFSPRRCLKKGNCQESNGCLFQASLSDETKVLLEPFDSMRGRPSFGHSNRLERQHLSRLNLRLRVIHP